MNTRFKMALLLRSGESGFALVIAVSLGLIMLLVGLTMTLRSQGDQVTASTQKQTERALAAAEKGIAFYQAFLNSSGGNRRLARYSDCINRASNSPGAACSDTSTTKSWFNVSNVTEISSACNLTNTTQIKNYYASTDWKDVDTTDSSQGQFRLVSYKYNGPRLTTDPGTGRLTIEGRIRPTQGNTNSNKSIARLEVGIPIKDGDVNSVPVPGVWIAGNNATDPDGTGTNGVKGDVLLNNCSITQSNLDQIQSKIVGNYKVRKTDLTMPAVPTQPANREIGYPPDNPPTDPLDLDAHFPGTIPLGTISGNVTLPDNTENFSNPSQPKPKDEHFKVDFGGEKQYVYSASFANGSTLKVKPNEKIVIFLTGSISQNVTITCETVGECKPTDLKIFARGSSGEICVNGTGGIDAFILAPNYTAGVAGGGNRQINGVDAGNFRGAVWVKQWGSAGCGSSSHNMLVEQVGTWDDIRPVSIGTQMPPSIKPIGTWTRKEIN